MFTTYYIKGTRAAEAPLAGPAGDTEPARRPRSRACRDRTPRYPAPSDDDAGSRGHLPVVAGAGVECSAGVA